MTKKTAVDDIVRIKDVNGDIRRVKLMQRFRMSIDNKQFEFGIFQHVAFQYTVTDIRSGLRVCHVSVSAAYLPALKGCRTMKERATLSVQELIDHVGAPSVRRIIEAASALPAEGGPTEHIQVS